MQNVIEMRIPNDEIEKVSRSIANEIANRLYYEFLLLRYLPEIELVKENKIKALKDDEITGFIKRRIEGKEK